MCAFCMPCISFIFLNKDSVKEKGSSSTSIPLNSLWNTRSHSKYQYDTVARNFLHSDSGSKIILIKTLQSRQSEISSTEVPITAPIVVLKNLQSYVCFHFGPLSNLTCKYTFSTALFSMKNFNPRNVVVLYLLASRILSQQGETISQKVWKNNDKMHYCVNKTLIIHQ